MWNKNQWGRVCNTLQFELHGPLGSSPWHYLRISTISRIVLERMWMRALPFWWLYLLKSHFEIADMHLWPGSLDAYTDFVENGCLVRPEHVQALGVVFFILLGLALKSKAKQRHEHTASERERERERERSPIILYMLFTIRISTQSR